MKTVSIMEAQHNLAKVLREVEAGHPVVITRHKKPVARLSPLENSAPVTFPDFKKRARATWGGNWKGSSSEALVAESRGDR